MKHIFRIELERFKITQNSTTRDQMKDLSEVEFTWNSLDFRQYWYLSMNDYFSYTKAKLNDLEAVNAEYNLGMKDIIDSVEYMVNIPYDTLMGGIDSLKHNGEWLHYINPNRITARMAKNIERYSAVIDQSMLYLVNLTYTKIKEKASWRLLIYSLLFALGSCLLILVKYVSWLATKEGGLRNKGKSTDNNE
jgi:hypothetical protein